MWEVSSAVAELINNFRWSQPFDHIESNKVGSDGIIVHTAVCCVCGMQIVLQTAFGRLSMCSDAKLWCKTLPAVCFACLSKVRCTFVIMDDHPRDQPGR